MSRCLCPCCSKSTCVCGADFCPCNWRREEQPGCRSALVLTVLHPDTGDRHVFGLQHSRLGLSPLAGAWILTLCERWRASRNDDKEAPLWSTPEEVTCLHCRRLLASYPDARWITATAALALKLAWGVRVDGKPSARAREAARERLYGPRDQKAAEEASIESEAARGASTKPVGLGIPQGLGTYDWWANRFDDCSEFFMLIEELGQLPPRENTNYTEEHAEKERRLLRGIKTMFDAIAKDVADLDSEE